MDLRKVYYDAVELTHNQLAVTLHLSPGGCPGCRLQRAMSAQVTDLSKLMLADGHKDLNVASQPKGGYVISCATCGVTIRLLPFGVQGMRIGPVEPMSHWDCKGG
jgi:hypothetical protein